MKNRPALLLRCCLSRIALMSAASVGGGVPSLRMAPDGSDRAQPPAQHTQDFPDVLYGVMTNGFPDFRAKFVAQLETWAAGVARSGRFFAVAGRGAEPVAGAGLIVEDRCPDDGDGIVCKEERLVEEGYTRGAQWLVILGDDNWVDTVRMDEALREHSAGRRGAAPAVLGVVGCGTHFSDCPEMTEFGGLCGGGGYAINRAALQALMKEGKHALRKEYAGMHTWPGDMASSCALRRRGVQLMNMPSFVGARIEKLTEFQDMLKMKTITLHYCTPDVMRWAQALSQGLPESEVQALEIAAFDGGCCCSADLKQCKQKVRPSLLQLRVLGGLPPLRLKDLRDAYIQERDRQVRATSAVSSEAPGSRLPARPALHGPAPVLPSAAW